MTLLQLLNALGVGVSFCALMFVGQYRKEEESEELEMEMFIEQDKMEKVALGSLFIFALYASRLFS